MGQQKISETYALQRCLPNQFVPLIPVNHSLIRTAVLTLPRVYKSNAIYRVTASRIRPYYNSGNQKTHGQPTSEQISKFNSWTLCDICKDVYTAKNPTFRPHNHLTGKFILPVDNNGNIHIKKLSTLPIFIHNLFGYDIHLLADCMMISHNYSKQHRKVPCYKQKLHNGIELRFCDSFRIMAASLYSLSRNLTLDKLKFTRSAFPNYELFNLARKGVYRMVELIVRMPQMKIFYLPENFQ